MNINICGFQSCVYNIKMIFYPFHAESSIYLGQYCVYWCPGDTENQTTSRDGTDLYLIHDIEDLLCLYCSHSTYIIKLWNGAPPTDHMGPFY